MSIVEQIAKIIGAGFGIGLMLGAFVGALAACLCGLVPFP